ncbi:monovalent cation/H(+) antiporter subunit G [Pseudarthrobacter sp. J75]|uniref:monovalent cation/H(+) antiporter subunit G n=2 Tax=Pseudarthrobacter TaxID=1742993 RepID=UPI002E7FD390|nr:MULTISPECIES: monovalent cation/H(+) antiporter subunit G [unclassified Pseudarthrobacter]MEE2524228.1 monovalent cation/H(+) antiporter subunit G [Pseudarthrobacter sp. J47]MEE2530175.1 monovalent cation/H(+) antiporter subunit G [Pseudarthrobacter sp. J75]
MNPEPSTVDLVIDSVSAVFMVVGALMSLAAAIGLLRFPDLLSRMHAATKPQVLGLFLLLAAIGLQMRTFWVWPVLLIAWLFQLLTVPVSAHMVGRAGYRTKHLHREMLTTDELEAVVQAATLTGRQDSADSPHTALTARDAAVEPDAWPAEETPGDGSSGK